MFLHVPSATDIVKAVSVSNTAVSVEWVPVQSAQQGDRVFGFTTDGQRCEGTQSSNTCTLEGLSAGNDYEVCVAVCHADSSTSASEGGFTNPTVTPFFVEVAVDGYICSVHSCVHTRENSPLVHSPCFF